MVRVALWDLQVLWGLGPLAAGPGDFEVSWEWVPTRLVAPWVWGAGGGRGSRSRC